MNPANGNHASILTPEQPDEHIERQIAESVQIPPNVTKEGAVNAMALAGWRGSILPAYGTRQREFALRDWYRADEQVLVRGGFSGLAKHIANLPWEISGDDADDEQVEYFQEILRGSNFGHGWGELILQVVLDFLRYDTGAFIEVIAPGDSYEPIEDAITGLAHLDPLRCLPTGDPMFPAIYYDRWGGLHVMHHTRLILIQDMNDGDDLRPGYGDSALSRAISIALRQMWESRYINAFLDDEPAPGLDIIGGIIKSEFERVEAQYKRQQQADTPPIWGKRMRYYTADPAVMPKVESIDFQSAPEKFDFRIYTDIDVDCLALAMGVDRLDLMQLSGGGAIGSEAQSIIMHQKSKGKTIGFLITELERRFNDVLPDGLEFSFRYRDEQEAKAEAEKANLWADVNAKTADVLSPEQRQRLLSSQVEAVRDAIDNETRVNDVDLVPESAPLDVTDIAPVQQPGMFGQAEFSRDEKTYASTQTDFVDRVASLIKQAAEKEGVIGRFSFGSRMRALLKDFGLRAFKDGMKEGGVTVNDLDPDDEEFFNEAYLYQAGFVNGMVDEIYTKGITPAAIPTRASMWGKSLEQFVNRGRVAANGNQMFEWQYGETEHCLDCLRLNGQVHRMKQWWNSGWLPRAGRLACKGYNCRCQLVKTDKTARGEY